MRAVRAGILAGLVVALQLSLAAPASACSCGYEMFFENFEEIEEHISGVYIADPRLPDPWPGRSFRVERTLKGPLRHNLRVPVTSDRDEARCGLQWVTMAPHVLFVDADGDPQELNACTDSLVGELVDEAIETLGPGTRMPWRPDLVYVAQWVVLAGVSRRHSWRSCVGDARS